MKFTTNTILWFLPLFFGATQVIAQIPQVPNQMEFADLTIRITPQAQREIQLDVDALYRNPTYFQVKQDRVNLFMPIVERELRKQGVPDDVKYLVIQESGLISDAVSTSNAVGFWQFKQGTAEEVGLRIDNQVDERKSIVSSTRGAALYLKKHNSILDNWMTALVSYQMGLGGAKAYFGNQFSGKKIVEVDRNTHWYFKKYLAHKVAYQNQLGVFVSSGPRLVELPIQGPVSMATLAKRYGVSEEHLIEFNKWALNGKIPAGSHTLFFIKDGGMAIEKDSSKPADTSLNTLEQSNPSKNYLSYKQADSYPRISGNTTKANQPNQITINELKGVQASDDLSTDQFASEIGMKEKKFRKLNDLKEDEIVETGKYYYTQKKKTSAEVETHLVQKGETLWLISQKYGIRLSALKSKNRIKSDSELKPGMILNLRESRKKGEEIPVVPIIESSIPETKISVASEPIRREANKETESFKPSSTPSSTPDYHLVSKGETLFSISKRYGVSVEDLKKWNAIGSQNIITVGQKLVIFTR
jgi:membrane-bound lytic murein transglycosylase D